MSSSTDLTWDSYDVDVLPSLKKEPDVPKGGVFFVTTNPDYIPASRAEMTDLCRRVAKIESLVQTGVADVLASLVTLPDPKEMRRRFETLANRWRRETQYCSSIYRAVMHPAYQQIIGMGPAAIPFILEDLARKPGFWFWALANISGDDPVPDDVRGDPERMATAWLEWGRERGYVSR